jgi:hypothetical protein
MFQKRKLVSAVPTEYLALIKFDATGNTGPEDCFSFSFLLKSIPPPWRQPTFP